MFNNVSVIKKSNMCGIILYSYLNVSLIWCEYKALNKALLMSGYLRVLPHIFLPQTVELLKNRMDYYYGDIH